MFRIVLLLITCNKIFTHIFSTWRIHKNLTFSFYEFENDKRVIETSLKIIITNFYSKFIKTNVISNILNLFV